MIAYRLEECGGLMRYIIYSAGLTNRIHLVIVRPLNPQRADCTVCYRVARNCPVIINGAFNPQKLCCSHDS